MFVFQNTWSKCKALNSDTKAWNFLNNLEIYASSTNLNTYASASTEYANIYRFVLRTLV